jgi:hypothetical protein
MHPHESAEDKSSVAGFMDRHEIVKLLSIPRRCDAGNSRVACRFLDIRLTGLRRRDAVITQSGAQFSC